jgi:nephrocystin-3
MNESKLSTIRVFVSSTFRDMHEERDALSKHVFPELRKRCAEMGVDFVGVDLRWGVPDGTERDQTLRVCFEEIERCKPFFIGLLGSRYGWRPAVDRDEADEKRGEKRERRKDEGVDPLQSLIEAQPHKYGWIERYLDRSVTELEIRHAVLDQREVAGRAFLYFRENGGAPETAEEAEQLKALKAEIREEEKLPVRDYTHPDDLKDQVLDDLWSVIEPQLPTEPPTAEERAEREHARFRDSRSRIYIERKDDTAALTAFVASEPEGKPLVVRGPSGIGKSALLANWAKGYSKEHPDGFVFEHYAAASADSARVDSLLTRLFRQIDRHLKDDQPEGAGEEGALGGLSRIGDDPDRIPTDPEELRRTLPVWLAKLANEESPPVLIIDGLDRLERGETGILAWLPDDFGTHLRVILSTTPGEVKEALARRGQLEHNLEVKPLGDAEREELIGGFLQRFGKKLSEEHRQLILEKKQTENPLYLRALLDELRLFGEHEKLGERIEHYLEATDPAALYQLILQRYEGDYSESRPKEALSLIACGRRGLAESELLKMLGKGEEPMPQAHWAPLHNALDENLLEVDGRLEFGHDYLRQAIHDRYLEDDETKRGYHLRIADELDTNRYTIQRQAEELPWQLWKATDRGRLRESLCDPDIFTVSQLSDLLSNDIMRYWEYLEPEYQAETEYSHMIDTLQQTSQGKAKAIAIGKWMGMFLIRRGRYKNAIAVLEQIRPIYERAWGESRLFTLATLNDLAVAHSLGGDHQSAARIAAEIRDRMMSQAEEPNWSDKLALLDIACNATKHLAKVGRTEEAAEWRMLLLQDAHSMLDGDNAIVANILDGFASDLVGQGFHASLTEAASLYGRIVEIRRRVYGNSSPQTASALTNLAAVRLQLNQPVEAKQHSYEAVLAYRSSIGNGAPQTLEALVTYATALSGERELEDAAAVFEDAIPRLRLLLGEDHVTVTRALSDYAVLKHKQGKAEQAKDLLEWVHSKRLNTLGSDDPDTISAAINLATVLGDLGHTDAAISLLQHGLAVREQARPSWHPLIVSAAWKLGEVLISDGKNAEGTEALERAIAAINEAPEVHGGTGVKLLNNYGAILQRMGDSDAACKAHQRAWELGKRILGPTHEETIWCAGNLADLLGALERFCEAALVYAECFACRKHANGLRNQHTLGTAGNLIYALLRCGKTEDAKQVMGDVIEHHNALFGRVSAEAADLRFLIGAGYYYQNMPTQAEKWLSDAYDIKVHLFGADDPATLQIDKFLCAVRDE